MVLTGFCSLIGCDKSTSSQQDTIASVKEAFQDIPDSVQLAAYWYWISDHISKEGVVKDLEAMKTAGINRAFIGSNIVNEGTPFGEHKIFSEAWWDILHTALKTATELDIEIGLFNNPGWSQSGGPWNKPEHSMRYIAATDTVVEGPYHFRDALPSLGSDAQDVKVLAYPVTNFKTKKWSIEPRDNNEYTLEMPIDANDGMQSLTINVKDRIRTTGKLYYKQGDTTYTLLKEIDINRSNLSLNVGFDPLAPIVVALPEVNTTAFRLTLDQLNTPIEAELTTQPLVERFPEKTLAKMFQTPLPYWHVYMWDKQPESTHGKAISPTDIHDISAHFNGHTLDWDIPDGQWKIVRLAMKTTGVTNSPASPEGTGLEVDKMSKKHVAHHFDSFLGEILRRIPEEDRRSFKVIVQDSYETGGQNWTDDMEERFKEVYGYDPIPYLPVLQGTTVGSRDISDRFLWDLRRLIADRVAYDYVGGLRDIGHQHGLTTWLENYGHWGFPGEFLQYGGQSDEIGGEFWSEGELGDIENRAASSSAHIYGKTKVWAESFTAAGKTFARTPYMMKQRGDRFFTEGINATLLHLYIHQPYEDRWPGMNAWFGNEFNRKNTWFEQMDVFADYLKRCNLVLQRGRYVADVAYFIGEDAPKMTGVADPALPGGYSFDYINAEILLNQASVKEGKLRLKSGMEYRVLVLPKQDDMRPELLKKIASMVKEGLVILGPAPKRSPSLVNYPQADAEVSALSNELWKDVTAVSYTKRGKGYVFGEGMELEDVFSTLEISPDFIVSDTVDVRFIHRTLQDGEIYFISNQEEKQVAFEATFRTTGGTPYLWDPVTGEVRLLPAFSQTGNATSLDIELSAFGSAFVVFDKNKGRTLGGVNFPKGAIMQTIESPWKVTFKSVNNPTKTIQFDTLYDWSTSKNDAIRFFSGLASYTTTFKLTDIPNNPIYIDLGKVMAMGKVYINGQYVGGVWAPPYRLNITDYIKEGDNTLEVQVANNWINALIGDAQLPEGNRKAWAIVNPYNAESPLQESGLLGPVTLQVFDYKIRK